MAKITNNKLNEKAEIVPGLSFNYSYLLIVLLPLFVYLPSINNGYVYFDDDILILENQTKLENPANIIKAFQTDAFFKKSSPYYRPILNISFILDTHISKSHPSIYHFMNIIYHIFSCLSLFWVLLLLGLKKELSLVGTLFFALHPMMASAVYWIPARNDLLVTLFSLIFVGTSILWFKDSKKFLFIAALISYSLAIFSKESAILLPFFLVIYIISTRPFPIDRAKLLFFFTLILITIFWILLRSNAIAKVGLNQVGIWAIITNYPFPLEIISKFFFPLNLAVTPIYSTKHTIIGSILSILLIVVLFNKKPKSVWPFLFGLFWYISFSLPNMFVRLDTSANSYDYLIHRAYLPVVGLLFSILTLIPENWFSYKNKYTIRIAPILLLVFAVNSILLSTKYKNAESFWNSAIVYNPNRAYFHHFLGRYYFKQKNLIKSKQQFRKAILLDEDPRFIYSLGMIYLIEPISYDSAFLYINKALNKGLNDPEANSNYLKLCVESSNEFFEKNEYRKAVNRCQIAAELAPKNASIAYNLGLYLIYCDENKKAAHYWRRSIFLDPNLKEAYRNLYYYYQNNTSNKDSIGYYLSEYRKRGGEL